MTKLEQLLLHRPIHWMHLESMRDGRDYTCSNYSGCIVHVTETGVVIQSEDRTRKYLNFYETQVALEKEPDAMAIWYAIAQHQGAVRKQQQLADRTPHDIYTLTDPRDNTVRYVGMSKQVALRYEQHIHCSGTNEYKNTWMRNLLEHGLLPELDIIEHVEGRYYAHRREEYWINHFLQMGLPLTNVGDWQDTTERVLV